MEITEQKDEKCVILALKGRLDTTNYTVFEKKLMDLAESQQDRILIECSEMDYISSSGLRILLMALKRINAAKGKFVLCGLQQNIREIFEISGFTTIFEVHASREDALKVF